jgi:hypothetical protein
MGSVTAKLLKAYAARRFQYSKELQRHHGNTFPGSSGVLRALPLRFQIQGCLRKGAGRGQMGQAWETAGRDSGQMGMAQDC